MEHIYYQKFVAHIGALNFKEAVIKCGGSKEFNRQVKQFAKENKIIAEIEEKRPKISVYKFPDSEEFKDARILNTNPKYCVFPCGKLYNMETEKYPKLYKETVTVEANRAMKQKKVVQHFYYYRIDGKKIYRKKLSLLWSEL